MSKGSSEVTVGLIQSRAKADPHANVQRAMSAVRDAAAQGAQIVCLQELFRTTYFCQTEAYAPFALAEPIPGPTTDLLGALAAELGVVLVVPVFEQRARGIYHNSAVVFDADGSRLGAYRKMHVPDDPAYYEKFYFTPGDLGFRTFNTRYANIGVLICWDQWFPEAARLTALAGAHILFYPTAIGWHEDEPDEVRTTQHEAWEMVQRSHAVTNGVYVAAANRVGREGSVIFWGASFVAAPDGSLVARAAHDREAVLVQKCDLAAVDAVRQHWPFLRDRRIDAYGSLTARLLDHGA